MSYTFYALPQLFLSIQKKFMKKTESILENQVAIFYAHQKKN